jgi:hypothetical protein
LPPGSENVIDDEGDKVGNAGHVKKLKQRPFEVVRFAADDNGSGETLGGENIINEQAHASCSGEKPTIFGSLLTRLATESGQKKEGNSTGAPNRNCEKL